MGRAVPGRYSRCIGSRPESLGRMQMDGDKRHSWNVGRILARRGALIWVILAMSCSWALAQTAQETVSQKQEEDALTKLEKSPWVIAPIFSSNPKLGTSLGAMVGYIHYFDEKSRPTIFNVMV